MTPAGTAPSLGESWGNSFTVRFVERNYEPFLINFVKAPQPEVQASVDAHQSFLQVELQPCQDR